MPHEQMLIVAGRAEQEHREAGPRTGGSAEGRASKATRGGNRSTQRCSEAREHEHADNRCDEDAPDAPWRYLYGDDAGIVGVHRIFEYKQRVDRSDQPSYEGQGEYPGTKSAAASP